MSDGADALLTSTVKANGPAAARDKPTRLRAEGDMEASENELAVGSPKTYSTFALLTRRES